MVEQKGTKWSKCLKQWETGNENEEPVEVRPRGKENPNPSWKAVGDFGSFALDVRQARDLVARKERGRFARRTQILRRRKACRLRMTSSVV